MLNNPQNALLLHPNNRNKTLVYHTVNGVHALFHTSKTAKIIKVIILRAPCQNVNVLLSNIGLTFIIFAVFDV